MLTADLSDKGASRGSNHRMKRSKVTQRKSRLISTAGKLKVGQAKRWK